MKKTVTKNIPKLRFREFSGEWQEKKLVDLFKNIGGTALENQVVENGSHKFISIGNYSKDGRYIDNHQRVELNDKTKEKLLNKGNLVMVLNDKTTAGDLIGSSILIDKDDSYVYNQRSERLICDSEIIPKYAWLVLNSQDFRKRVYKLSQGGTQIYVNFPSVKKLEFTLPSVEEQEKIAEFLGVVDEKIEQLQAKKGLLEKYKKGVMQAIFSQKIRFKDENGIGYPKWVEKRIDALIKPLAKSSRQSSEGKSTGNYPFFDNSTKNHIRRLDDYDYSTEAVIANTGGVAFFDYYNGKFATMADCYVFEAVSNTRYLYFFLKWIEKLIDYKGFFGSGIKHLDKKYFRKLEYLHPISNEEQQKIADFLTSLNDRINLAEKELGQAKKFKKALLQQMFV